MKTLSCVAIVGGFLAANAVPTAAQEHRGLYWYSKYFGPTEIASYRGREGEGLPRWELIERAFDQGFYNAHHFHHAASKPEIYALAREAGFDNEVAITIDPQNGEVIESVVLPH
jgi:hypothetical protein